MEGETQVMHAVVAVGEAEIDVASTELHGLSLVKGLAILGIIGIQDRGVIHRFTIAAFQDTALQPDLIGAGENGNIVELYLVLSLIGKDKQTCCRVE